MIEYRKFERAIRIVRISFHNINDHMNRSIFGWRSRQSRVQARSFGTGHEFWSAFSRETR